MDENGYVSVIDWCDWNEGKIDDSEWQRADTTFLFSGRSDKDIEKIYSYFPQCDELLKRYQRARRNHKTINREYILSLVRKDLINMREIALLAGNKTLAKFLSRQLPIEFEPRTTNSIETKPHSKVLYDFLETLNDYVIFNTLKQTPSANDIDAGLYYAHGNNFQVTHALLSPLIKDGHFFDHYLELYAQKVHYEVFETGVRIYC